MQDIIKTLENNIWEGFKKGPLPRYDFTIYTDGTSELRKMESSYNEENFLVTTLPGPIYTLPREVYGKVYKVMKIDEAEYNKLLQEVK